MWKRNNFAKKFPIAREKQLATGQMHSKADEISGPKTWPIGIMMCVHNKFAWLVKIAAWATGGEKPTMGGNLCPVLNPMLKYSLNKKL